MTLFIQSIEPRTNDVGKFRRFDQRFVNAIWSKVMDADIADWKENNNPRVDQNKYHRPGWSEER